MDLTIPIIGLMGVLGYKLNGNGKKSRGTEELRDTLSPHTLPSNKNVYSSVHSKEILAKEQELMNLRNKQAINGIIPPPYNDPCVTGLGNCEAKTTTLPQLSEPQKYQENMKNQIFNGPMFTSKLQQPGRATGKSSFTPLGSANFTGISKLSGLPMEMTHDNMTPSFGGSSNKNNTEGSGYLEKYTGVNDSTFYKSKSERESMAPMFAPRQSENVYGMQAFTETIDNDRFFKSNSMNNVMPFAQIQTAPILPEYVRPTYKTTDELRAANNPKLSYAGRNNMGQNENAVRVGSMGQISKNRPITYRESGPEHGFVTGANQAPRPRENFDIYQTARADWAESAGYIAPATIFGQGQYVPNIGENDTREPGLASEKLAARFRPSKKIETESGTDWIRNFKSSMSADNLGDLRNSHTIYDTDRELTSRQFIGNAGDSITGIYSPMTDEPRITNKEGNSYSYIGNARSSVEGAIEYPGEYSYTKEKLTTNTPYYLAPAVGDTHQNNYNNSMDNFHSTTNRDNLATIDYRTAGGIKENIMLGVDEYHTDTKYENNYEYISPAAGQNNTFGAVGEIHDGTSRPEYDYTDRIEPDLLTAFTSNPYTQPLNVF